jgi:hypothetical protein
MHACCCGDAGPKEARSQAGSCCAERRSSMLAMSLVGRRCSEFIPASARARKWRMPLLPRSVNARYVPRCAAGTDWSVIEKSRTCNS